MDRMTSFEVGQEVPDFTLPASNGEDVSLHTFRGKKVVIYFYPKDMTPGCTTEACDFRDASALFDEADTVILGISPDSVERHHKFIAKYDLPFLLLADEEHEVAEKYGVWKQKKMFGKTYMGVERSTFLIDEEGKLIKEWRKVKVQGHTEEVLQHAR